MLLDQNSGDVLIDSTLVEHVLLQRCKSGSLSSDHKTQAYLCSLLGFALSLESASDENPESGSNKWVYSPRIWGNCLLKTRDHVKGTKTLSPRVRGLLLAFLDQSADVMHRAATTMKCLPVEGEMEDDKVDLDLMLT